MTATRNDDFARYRPDNIVYCLAIYEWERELTVVTALPLFERVAELIGAPPDDSWVCRPGEWKGKSYRHQNFLKRDILHQEPWANLHYAWRRQPDARAYLAAGISMGLDLGRRFDVEIDEAVTANAAQVYEAVLSTICEALQPTYGVGFFVPYSWGPGQFMAGQGSGYAGTEEGLEYNSWAAFCTRGERAGKVLLAKSRVLDQKMLDIFAINLISEKHLATPIDGVSLKQWIRQSGHGTLNQINSVTWRWEVSRSNQPPVRKAAISAGLIADPFWTKLGWVDGGSG